MVGNVCGQAHGGVSGPEMELGVKVGVVGLAGLG